MRSAYSRDSGSGFGAHPQQQRLERLTGPVDADIRRGRRRQDAAHRVERLRPGGGAVDELAVVRITCDGGADVLGDQFGRVAVRVEDAIEIADVAGTERAGEHRGIAEVPVPAAEAGVVGDVARALLEIAHQASPLEDLGEQVRRLFAGEVDAAELGDRVVAVVEEDPLVQLLGPFEADRGVDRLVAGDVEVAHELVEEQPSQRLRAAAVAGEQRALHDLGKVDEREHRTVEVREVPAQYVSLVRGEGFGDVHSHGATSYGRVPAGPVIDRYR